MICPYDKTKMVNFETEEIHETSSVESKKIKVVKPLPSGGISNDEVYEVWEIKVCSTCGRKVREAYRCEVL